MKRLISAVLLLALMLALVSGCASKGEKSPANTTTPETEAATAPDEVKTNTAERAAEIQEMLANGEEVIIGLSFQGLTDMFTLIQKEFFDEEFGKLGYTTVTADSAGDTALMIEQIENFVTMKAALIIAFPPDAESVMDVCTQAVDAGVYVLFTGLETDDAGYSISGGSTVNWRELGANMAKMALAWVDITYPDAEDGSIHAALGKFSYFVQSIPMFESLEATLETDPRMKVTYTEDNVITVDQGFNAAENAFTADPNIRLLFCFQETGAQGMDQYILSQQLDRSLYAVFTQGTSENSAHVVANSKNNDSVYRGTIVYGGDENPAADTFRVACAILNGEVDTPYWSILEQHSINGFGFEL